MKSLDAFGARIIAEKRTRIALKLLKLGKCSLADIADACELPLEQVQELANSLNH